jgi:hypothetical protein
MSNYCGTGDYKNELVAVPHAVKKPIKTRPWVTECTQGTQHPAPQDKVRTCRLSALRSPKTTLAEFTKHRELRQLPAVFGDFDRLRFYADSL